MALSQSLKLEFLITERERERERERESIINWLTDFRCLNHVSLSVCILCVDHTHANSQEYT